MTGPDQADRKSLLPLSAYWSRPVFSEPVVHNWMAAADKYLARECAALPDDRLCPLSGNPVFLPHNAPHAARGTDTATFSSKCI
jgi:hypothetical protein